MVDTNTHAYRKSYSYAYGQCKVSPRYLYWTARIRMGIAMHARMASHAYAWDSPYAYGKISVWDGTNLKISRMQG